MKLSILILLFTFNQAIAQTDSNKFTSSISFEYSQGETFVLDGFKTFKAEKNIRPITSRSYFLCFEGKINKYFGIVTSIGKSNFGFYKDSLPIAIRGSHGSVVGVRYKSSVYLVNVVSIGIGPELILPIKNFSVSINPQIRLPFTGELVTDFNTEYGVDYYSFAYYNFPCSSNIGRVSFQYQRLKINLVASYNFQVRAVKQGSYNQNGIPTIPYKSRMYSKELGMSIGYCF